MNYSNLSKYISSDPIFEVFLDDKPSVFMTISPAKYSFEPHSIVQVNCEKFLNFWRRNPCDAHKEFANGNPMNWVKHYKYDLAAGGFAQGASNPVPCAEVFCEMDASKAGGDVMSLNFHNGITRTIWLLSNGCKLFPVLCITGHAEILQFNAGEVGTSPINLQSSG
jgi:hypothetical protein